MSTTGSPAPRYTPEQLAVRNWLRGIAPSLEEAYVSFLALASHDGFPGRARLIAHCLREIGNGLVNRIVGYQARLEYTAQLDGLSDTWSDPAGPGDGAIPLSTEVTIPRPVAERISALLRMHTARRGENVDRVQKLFASFQLSRSANVQELYPVARAWHELLHFFHGRAHNQETDAERFDKEFQQKVSEFERSLLTFAKATDFFEGIKEIDDILAEANRPAS